MCYNTQLLLDIDGQFNKKKKICKAAAGMTKSLNNMGVEPKIVITINLRGSRGRKSDQPIAKNASNTRHYLLLNTFAVNEVRKHFENLKIYVS